MFCLAKSLITHHSLIILTVTLHIRPNEKLGTIIACKKRGRTPLTEFFHQSAKDAAPKLLYGEFKELYRWDNSLKKWLKRKNKLVVLARLVFVAPAEGSQRFRACHNRLIFSGSSDGDSKPSIRGFMELPIPNKTLQMLVPSSSFCRSPSLNLQPHTRSPSSSSGFTCSFQNSHRDDGDRQLR